MPVRIIKEQHTTQNIYESKIAEESYLNVYKKNVLFAITT